MGITGRTLKEKEACLPGFSQLFFLAPVVHDCQNVAGFLLALTLQGLSVAPQQAAFLCFSITLVGSFLIGLSGTSVRSFSVTLPSTQENNP